MAKDKKWVTADELMARLEADPDWVRRRDEREAKHAAEVAKLQSELEPEVRPLRRDLASVGLNVDRISQLINTAVPYPQAVPVLLRHLETARHPVLRDMLARALTVREAVGIAAKPILRELKREENHDVRFAMANALTIVATPDDEGELAALVKDPAYADVQRRLKQALKNVRADRRAQAMAPPPAPPPAKKRKRWLF